MTLQVGQPVNGFCRGLFGRDSYGNRRIEAMGYDWIVTRDENDMVEMASGAERLSDIEDYVKEYPDGDSYDC